MISDTKLTLAVPQAFDAVGGVNVGVAGHCIVAFPPGFPIVGVALPCIVID